MKYADIYLHENRVHDAEKVLLSRSSFRMRSSIAEQLRKILTQYEQADTLRLELENAVNNYFIDSTYDTRDGTIRYGLPYCCIYFLGAKVGYYRTSVLDSDEDLAMDEAIRLQDRQKIIGILKKSDLYAMVQKL